MDAELASTRSGHRQKGQPRDARAAPCLTGAPEHHSAARCCAAPRGLEWTPSSGRGPRPLPSLWPRSLLPASLHRQTLTGAEWSGHRRLQPPPQAVRMIPRGRHNGWLPGRPARDRAKLRRGPAPQSCGRQHAPRPGHAMLPDSVASTQAHAGSWALLLRAGPPQVAPGMQNVLGWARPLPTGQKVSLLALKDVLGTQRARDKGRPSRPLTPSLPALPAGGGGGCPCSCLLSSGSSQPRRRLRQPLAGSQTVRPRPLPAGPAPQHAVPRLSNCRHSPPRGRVGGLPLSGSASRCEGDTEFGEALRRSRPKGVCPRGLSTREELPPAEQTAESSDWRPPEGP